MENEKNELDEIFKEDVEKDVTVKFPTSDLVPGSLTCSSKANVSREIKCGRTVTSILVSQLAALGLILGAPQ